MFKIAIPQPCHENWQQMTPTTQGAFCKACAKEVVDFTKMTDGEVQNFLLQRTHQKVCGRFQPQQLSRIELHIPAFVFTKNVASWKKYLAIVLLAFGTVLVGCDVKTDNHLMGEPAFTTPSSATTDTIETKGRFDVPVPKIMDTLVEMPMAIQGDIAVAPPVIPPDYGIAGGIQLIRIDSVAMPAADTTQPAADTGAVKQTTVKDSSTCDHETYW